MKKQVLIFSSALLLTLAFSSCANNENSGTASDTTNDSANAATAAGITQADWGEVDGKKVALYTLTNKNGVQVKITNYGGIVTSWVTPDKNGQKSDVVLGFNDLKGYQQPGVPFFGALIGRYGNRIGNAQFALNGQTYKLAANDGKNHLHGGTKGFDKVVWDATPATGTPSLTLSYLSKDGEEGYPGNLQTTVKYTLTDEDELLIEYDAETDKATPVNLTNHSYFNLTGDVSNTILNHTLWVDADRLTPVDNTLIPTGVLQPVKGTPFDFTQPHKIGERIDTNANEQLKFGKGYDHNFVLNKQDSSLKLVAYVTDSISGRKLEVYTTEPGLQFYTGNFLDGSLKNRDDKAINFRTAFCLETQHYPDSPNKPKFPSTTLNPGQKYHTVTKYKVSVGQ